MADLAMTAAPISGSVLIRDHELTFAMRRPASFSRLLTLLLTLAAAACGGGGGGPTTGPVDPCSLLVPSVTTGYASGYTNYGTLAAGPCDPRTTADGSATSGDGSGADGSAGDGGAGAGASEGRFRRAMVRVYKADGTLLGQAMVDDLKGMVTIQPASYRGPALIEIVGSATAEYFDEAKNAYKPFPAGESLRVLVPDLSTASANVGITAFTEAAVRYYLAQPGQSLSRLDATAIRAANAVVQAAVNKLLPAGNPLADLTSLPHLIGPDTAVGSVQNSDNGYYGIALAGLAIAAGDFNPASDRPAALISAQLAADLADGILDFVGPNGQPVAPAGQAAYSPATIGTAVSTAIDTAATRYASPALQETLASAALGYAIWPDSAGGLPLFVQLQPSGDLLKAPPTPAVLARDVYTLGATLGAGYAIGSDGRVLASGPNTLGQLGVGTLVPGTGVTTVSGFGTGLLTATAVAGGTNHAVARTSTGAVLAWGDNGSGQLGLSASTSVSPAPATVPGAPAALTVAASANASYLLSGSGDIYAWGGGPNGELGLGSAILQVSTPTRVTLSDTVVGLDCARQCLAVTRGGRVMGWGNNSLASVGNGSRSNVFTPVDLGLSNIVTAVADGEGAGYALTRTGTLYTWGGSSAYGENSAGLSPRMLPTGTPSITSLYRMGRQVFARSGDGRVYVVTGSLVTPLGAGPAATGAASGT